MRAILINKLTAGIAIIWLTRCWGVSCCESDSNGWLSSASCSWSLRWCAASMDSTWAVLRCWKPGNNIEYDGVSSSCCSRSDPCDKHKQCMTHFYWASADKMDIISFSIEQSAKATKRNWQNKTKNTETQTAKPKTTIVNHLRRVVVLLSIRLHMLIVLVASGSCARWITCIDWIATIRTSIALWHVVSYRQCRQSPKRVS